MTLPTILAVVLLIILILQELFWWHLFDQKNKQVANLSKKYTKVNEQYLEAVDTIYKIRQSFDKWLKETKDNENI